MLAPKSFKARISVVANAGRRSFLAKVGAGIALVASTRDSYASNDTDPHRDYADKGGNNSISSGDASRTGDPKK
jgi:hypothetical protein